MTTDTSFFDRIMLKFDLGDDVAYILMAAEAELIPGFRQIKLMIRGVGVVAFPAIAFQNNFVAAARFLRNYRLVTLAANFVGFLGQ